MVRGSIITARSAATRMGPPISNAVHQDPETLAENTARPIPEPVERLREMPPTRSRSGRTTSITPSPTSSPGSGRKAGAATRAAETASAPSTSSRAATSSSRAPANRRFPPPRWRSPRSRIARRTSREALADWLVAPENPNFARSITNRIWAAYFGSGLVEPVDDLRASNPASNERAPRRAHETPRRKPVRPEGAHAGDPPERDLPAQWRGPLGKPR